MSRVVHPVGPTNRPILALVGEAPGAEEERTGKPFVGNAGFLLDQLLAATGITRRDCYITNVSNRRPPGNDFNVYYSDSKGLKPTSELLDMRMRLKREIHEVKPHVVVAMGDEALKATTALTGITAHRGCMHETFMFGEPERVLPTFHPANLFHQYTNRPIVELDLKK